MQAPTTAIDRNVTLTIDGARITVRQGQSAFDAANENGIAVPSLCHHMDLSLRGHEGCIPSF